MEIIENKILKLYILKTFTDFRERERKGGWEGGGEGGRERDIDLLFHLVMHLLVASCMCSDQRLNLQPRCIGTML